MTPTAVVILHYRNVSDTVGCLSSLYGKKKKQGFSVIVVAVAEKEKGMRPVAERFPEATLITTAGNIGFAGGCNLGIQKAVSQGARRMILLNNDTVLSPELVGSLSSFADSHPDVGCVSPKIYFAPGFEYHAARYAPKERGNVIWYAGGILDWANVLARHRGVDDVDEGQFDETVPTDFATGCCMLVTREAVDRVGLFNTDYFLYFEDVEYSMRVREAGLGVVYFPGASLWHKNAASSDSPGSNVHVYYQTRNRLAFGLARAPFRTKFALIRESIRMMMRQGIKRKAVLDYYRGRMGIGDFQ